MLHHTTTDAAEFFDRINSYLPVEDRLRVQEAYALARREHGDQRRKSGELFFTHPLTVLNAPFSQNQEGDDFNEGASI